MTLFNADGSASELSGNGLRCLAAILVRAQNLPVGATVRIHTAAGVKPLELLKRVHDHFVFRAELGVPRDIRTAQVTVGGEALDLVLLNVGNPQCVILGPLPDPDRFERLGSALSTHAMFPAGTNVEFACVEASDRVRILIWERGVGPTTASGTGAAASAVAAISHGGAARALEVHAPGGRQRVEWRDNGIHLTGWAEIVLDGQWLVPARLA